MEDTLEVLQNALLGILKNVLLHEHYFSRVQEAYEVAVYRPMSVFPLFPQPAPLIYRTKSLKRSLSSLPVPIDPTAPRTPHSIGLILNESALNHIKSSQPDFNHIVSDFKSRIRESDSAAQSSERLFLSKLKSQNRLKPLSKPQVWDQTASELFASSRMLAEMGRIISGDTGKQCISACTGDDKSYYTMEEAAQMLKHMHFLLWVERELPKIREIVRKEESKSVCEFVKELLGGNGGRTEGLFDDFKGEHGLLLRMKECLSWTEFKKVRREYEGFCLWHAQAEVVKYVKTRVQEGEGSVQTLRCLLSILGRGGKAIGTVERSRASSIK